MTNRTPESVVIWQKYRRNRDTSRTLVPCQILAKVCLEKQRFSETLSASHSRLKLPFPQADTAVSINPYLESCSCVFLSLSADPLFRSGGAAKHSPWSSYGPLGSLVLCPKLGLPGH